MGAKAMNAELEFYGIDADNEEFVMQMAIPGMDSFEHRVELSDLFNEHVIVFIDDENRLVIDSMESGTYERSDPLPDELIL